MSRLRYLAARAGQLVAVLVVVSFLTFLLVHLLPGDPVTTILGPGATASARRLLSAQLGLNKPIPAGYATWLWHVLQGNLGESYLTHQTVVSALGQALPVDVELLIFSQIMALAVAIPLAMVAARRPGGWLDQIASSFTFGMLAVPAFVIGVILQQVLAVHFHLLPATGWTAITPDFGHNIRDVVLPSVTIALGSLAGYMRLLRADMISTLQEDFITMARAKGLSTPRIFVRHAFRPSTFSLLTVAGLSIAGVISGAFVVEYIFALPGLGLQAINAIGGRDYLVLQGDILVITVLFVLANFFVDFLYSVIDPRTRRAAAVA